MNEIILDPGQWGLPQIGTDWLDGFEDCYLLVNPLYSTNDRVKYWRHAFEECHLGFGYGSDAGVFSGADIRAQIHTLNNGLTHVAVPCTWTALWILARLDFNDEFAFDAFASIQYCVYNGKANSQTPAL